MSSTLEDRLKSNYEKAINEGRNVYVRVDTVLLKGVPVADKFIGLSNAQKKNLGFNVEQIRTIESRCSLNALDLSLLHVIQRAFGGLGPGHLQDLLKDLKDLRNTFIHEQQTLSLSKRELKAKLATLKILYRSILEELKTHCDPVQIPLIDNDIADIDARLLLLTKTLDDHIQEKTVALTQASAKAATQMTQSSVKLDHNITQSTGILSQAVTQASVNLDDTINQAKVNLDQNLNQTIANLDQQINNSTDNLKQEITQATSTLDQNFVQATGTLNQTAANLDQRINRSTDALKQNITHATSTLDQNIVQATGTLNQTAANLDQEVNNSSDILKRKITHATSTLDQTTSTLNQSSTTLNLNIVQATGTLNQTVSNLDQQVNKSTDTLKKEITQSTSTLYQNISQATGTLNKTATNLSQQTIDNQEVLDKISQATNKLDQVVSNISQQLNKLSAEGQNLNQNENQNETSVILKIMNKSISEDKTTKCEESNYVVFRNCDKITSVSHINSAASSSSKLCHVRRASDSSFGAYFCDICQAPLTGKRPLDQHVNGRRHNKKLRNMLDLADIFMLEKKPDNPADYQVITCKLPVQPNEYTYKNLSTPRGHVHIFNNSFQNDPEYCRNGAHKDIINLIYTFENMGYKVYIHIDLDAEQLYKVVDNIQKEKELDAVDSFIMVILSYGVDSMRFYASDMEPIHLDDIRYKFTDEQCPQLRGKPKFFFCQYGRGRKRPVWNAPVGPAQFLQTDAICLGFSPRKSLLAKQNSLKDSCDVLKDMVTVHASYNGFMPFRHPSEGSIFVQSLCKTLSENAHNMEFRRIYLILSRIMEDKSGSTPELQEYVFKEFYFNPTKQRSH